MNTETQSTTKTQNVSKQEANRQKIFQFIFTLLKNFLFVLLIYLIFHLYLSFIWIIALVILLTLREEQNHNKRKKHALKEAAVHIDEKEAIEYKISELPPWVMFPDVDRAEWLNTVVAQMWPTLNNYVVKYVRTTVQKKIRKKFDSFRFEEVDLGCVSPRIDGVKVYNNRTGVNEIILDFSLFYDGNCDVNFTLYGTKGSIKDFQFSSELRIVLKPIMFKMPLVGGIQIFFVNNPDMDFNLEGIVNIPGLHHYIKKRLNKILFKKLVFPNKIPFRFSKSVDAAELKSLEPEGVLRVHVVEAKDLERRDVNVLGTGKSDPYATISVGAQEYKTKIIEKTLDPKWDFWCEFCILNPTVQDIDIEVLDHDINSDDFLGSATVDVSRIVSSGKKDQWVTLEKVKHGKIHLRFTWFTLTDNYKDLDEAIDETKLLEVTGLSTALLTVYIEYARNIPLVGTHKKPDPYIVLTLGHHKEKTKTKKHTTEAVFEQGLSILIAHPETDTLYITLMNKKSGEVLDQYKYQVGNLIDKPNMQTSKTEHIMDKGTALMMSLDLKILKRADAYREDSSDSSSEEEISRNGSTKSTQSTASKKSKANSNKDTESPIHKLSYSINELVHRSPSVTASSGKYALGQIQLTLRYSEPRQKLVVVVHKIGNLPLKDPSDIPDPYVKLLLLPGGPNKKQKTRVIMDDCNPVYDQTFEYVLCHNDLASQKLIVTVKSKIKLSLANKFMGQVVINLSDFNLSQPFTSWFDLTPVNVED